MSSLHPLPRPSSIITAVIFTVVESGMTLLASAISSSPGVAVVFAPLPFLPLWFPNHLLHMQWRRWKETRKGG